MVHLMGVNFNFLIIIKAWLDVFNVTIKPPIAQQSLSKKSNRSFDYASDS